MGKLLAGLIGIAVLLLGGALLWPREPSTAQQLYEAQRWADQLAADRWWDSFWRAVLVGAVGALALLVFGGIVLLLVRGTIANIQTAQAPARRMVQVGPVVVPAAHLLTGHAAPLLPGIIEGHYAAELAKAQRGGTPQSLTHNPTYHYAYEHRGVEGPAPVITDLPALALPGVTTFGQILTTGWRPSQQSILLGLGPGGTPLTVPTGDTLCHVALSGTTGAGKTNLLRLLLTQLEAAGCAVYLCDPHYADIDPKTGEDWRAIAAHTAPGRAIYDPAEIAHLLGEVNGEIDRRLLRRRNGLGDPPRFYAIEEAPNLAAADKVFMERLARILREGRKLNLFLILTAQDMLIKTLGGSIGDFAQFETGYYGGGDPSTGRRILKSRAEVAEPPGKGVVWLRSAVTKPPQLVRVPLVENADIAGLLGVRGETERNGDETDETGNRAGVVEGQYATIGKAVSSVSLTPETGIDPAKRAAVLAALQTEESYSDIMRRVWQAKPGGGPGWITAGQEMRAILADLAKGSTHE